MAATLTATELARLILTAAERERLQRFGAIMVLSQWTGARAARHAHFLKWLVATGRLAS